MTDEQAVEFLSRLTLLAEVLAEPMTPTRLAGYRAAVDDLDPSDLAAALNDCARMCRFFPKPVEIRVRVGAIVDAREMRMLQALQDREASDVPKLLPPPAPVPQPTETPEEAASRRARVDAAWQALFAKAREMAAQKAMPDAIEQPNTVIQIRQWRKDRTA